MTGSADRPRGAREIIGDVQRFGLLAAASVVDRYVEIVNRERVGDPLRRAREALVGAAEGSGDGVSRMLEAGLHALDTAARLVGDASSHAAEKLVLPRTAPGLDSEATLWIHNRTASLDASVELHTTVLVSAEEASIPEEAVTFRPAGAVLVEPGTCRAVQVRVSVPRGQPVGRYHGILVGSGAPDGALSLLLEVAGPGGAA